MQGEHGKPSLTASQGQVALCFNLSHSEDVVLFGIAIGREVGVDVESIHRHLDVMEIARSSFSSEEVAALTRSEPERRVRAFFELWTHREVLLKAMGTGLAAGLSPVQGAREREPDGRQWRVRSLDLAPGYAGAVAAEGEEWFLKCWTASHAGGTASTSVSGL